MIVLRKIAGQDFGEISSLLMTNFVTLPVGILTSVLATKVLGVSNYGDYKFIHSILNFAIVIFSFGLPEAFGRAVVLVNDNGVIRNLFGGSQIAAVLLALPTSIAILFYVCINEYWLDEEVYILLFSSIPFILILYMMKFLESGLQSYNKTNEIIYLRMIPRVLFLIILYLIYNNVASSRNLITVVIAYFGSIAIAIMYVLFRIKCRFNHIKGVTNRFKNHFKYGLNIYFGSIFVLGVSRLSEIFISSYGFDNSELAFFSIALVMASPISLIPNSIATVKFKEFSKSERIPEKVLLLTLLLTAVPTIGFISALPYLVRLMYGIEFLEVVGLAKILIIGFSMTGLADLLNRFLLAHGEGRVLRNASIIVGMTLLVLNLILIPLYGAKGAAVAKVLSSAIYLVIIFISYKLVSK